MEVLAGAGADLVAMETIPSIKEAAALLELLREFPETRAWLAFSCQVGGATADRGAELQRTGTSGDHPLWTGWLVTGC